MIGRKKEIREIKQHIEHKQSVLITGRKGVGKTFLLKNLAARSNAVYVEFATTKPILEALVEYFEIPVTRNTKYMTAKELLDLVRPFLDKSPVILLDEASSITKYCGRVLNKLAEEGVIFIGASKKKVWNFRFKKTIELEPLSKKESKELADKLLGKISTSLLVDLTVTKSLGIPGKIKEICEDAKAYQATLELDILSESSVYDFFKDIKPEFPEKINILPFEYLFAVGFGLLLTKYLYFDKGDLRTAYLMGGLGYLTLIVWRALNTRKYKRYK